MQELTQYGAQSSGGYVPGIQPAARRPLKIFAFDPSSRRAAGNLAVVEIGNEEVDPGPVGRLVQVVDYDATQDVYYPAVDLNDKALLMQRGLDPSDSDPRFHQQMVYAVVMKVIENVERALGRPFHFRGEEKLTILPHAFEGENAYYDPDTLSLLFGYFTADSDDPGPNLPGQTVFTCLSHDIVAHETAHAVIDRLRPGFNTPTNRDVLAFHEGIADIVSIFQHFSFPEVLQHHVRATRTDLSQPGPLLELARQFGYATGSGQALRSATGLASEIPPADQYEQILEPHERGSILVAAVFDAFFRIYRNRMAQLLRAVTGGTGILPAGELQADLAALTRTEAADAADDVLTMCLRAFEYMPPVDVTFGDYLRAIVTADFELNPKDEFERRVSFIDAFGARGIYAPAVSSLAEEALRLTRPPELEQVSIPDTLVTTVLASQFDVYDGTVRRRRQIDWAFPQLQDFAKVNAEALLFDKDLPVGVKGMHPSFRVDENGQLRVELVAQWVQTPKTPETGRVEIGGVVLSAGTTAVFGADGRVRYIASRPLPGPHLHYDGDRAVAEQRVADFRRYVDQLDGVDALQMWSRANYLPTRMQRRSNFTATHRSRRSWRGRYA